MTERFLRLFPAYRKLIKDLRHKDDALNLSQAIILTTRNDIAKLQKKIESNTALINSLNRYIETLEGKAKMQAEQIQELRDELQTLLGITRNQKHKEDQK